MDLRAGVEVEIALTVNGVAVRRRIEARKTLVDFLREDLELTGSHVGCEHGVCGACTMRVDGALARGCLMLAAQCDGLAVETIEGVAASGEIADLQRAFAEVNALQCGFCTPAMLLTADALLRDDPTLDAAAARQGLSGNYCRCTGYHAIIEAVLATARTRGERRG
jgi:carbon-monoxide dehydrogenase small subunit